MKRSLAILITCILTAVLCMGCASDQNPNTPCLAERLVGRYCRYGTDTAEEPEMYLDIYFLNGLLIAEGMETQAAYWAMELIPQEEADLYSTESDTIQVEAHIFSGFSNFGEYWPEKETYNIYINDTGVDFTPAKGNTVHYIRDDTLEPQHNPERYRETLASGEEIAVPERLCGIWKGETDNGANVYLTIRTDGTMQCLYKQPGEPVRLRIGLMAVDQDQAVLTCITEQVGWAMMPYEDTVRFTWSEDGSLLLHTTESCAILPCGETVSMQKQSGQE